MKFSTLSVASSLILALAVYAQTESDFSITDLEPVTIDPATNTEDFPSDTLTSIDDTATTFIPEPETDAGTETTSIIITSSTATAVSTAPPASTSSTLTRTTTTRAPSASTSTTRSAAPTSTSNAAVSGKTAIGRIVAGVLSGLLAIIF